VSSGFAAVVAVVVGDATAYSENGRGARGEKIAREPYNFTQCPGCRG
jgi:hypothetical protein